MRSGILPITRNKKICMEVCTCIEFCCCQLSNEPALSNHARDFLHNVERFSVLLYHHTSNCIATNELRGDLFCQGCSINNILPASAALSKPKLCSTKAAKGCKGRCKCKESQLPCTNLCQ